MPAPAALKENGDRSPSVSIRDVARAAGVSYQTVSRVINESSSVKNSTRESVLDAIARLGFRPNRAARALAGGPVQSVTVLTSNTSLYGQSAALEGIEEATREAGFAMGVRVIEHAALADVRDAVERALEPAGALIVIAFDRPGMAALDCVPNDVPVASMMPAPADDEVPSRPAVWIDEYTAAKGGDPVPVVTGPQDCPPPVDTRAGPARRGACPAGAPPWSRRGWQCPNRSSVAGAPNGATKWAKSWPRTPRSPLFYAATTILLSESCAPCTKQGAPSPPKSASSASTTYPSHGFTPRRSRRSARTSRRWAKSASPSSSR